MNLNKEISNFYTILYERSLIKIHVLPFFYHRIEIVRKRILRFAAAAGGVDTHLNTPAAQPCAGAARQQTQTAF